MKSVMIDSSAWLELLDGTPAGIKVKEVMNANHCLTPAVVVAEVCSRTRRKGLDVNLVFQQLAKTEIVPLDGKVSFMAGKLHAEQRIRKPDFGIVDAIIIAAAQSSGARLLTLDQDFRTFPGVILLKQ